MSQIFTIEHQHIKHLSRWSILAVAALVTACGGGSGSGVNNSTTTSSGSGTTVNDCNFTISSTPQNLSAAEVERIVAQAEQAANALGRPATIAVTDRVGNVLGFYRMAGASTTVNLRSGKLPNSVAVQGLDGLNNTIGSDLAAIAKAVTGAYLSSSGNAFSTRTASFIIQEHFAPTVSNQPSGPLFGVQFSQLPCGDFVNQTAIVDFGPKRSPLGLAGDPGGFPIYKNGRVVGGIGVMSDSEYSIDVNPVAGTTDSDEQIAQSATAGFEAPACIRGDRITAGGLSLNYSNADNALVSVNRTTVTGTGTFPAVAGYYAGGATLAGKAYGDANSGFADDPTDTLGNGAFVVTNGASNRFAPVAGSAAGGNSLTSSEVTSIISSAIGVANISRAQIRRPVGSAAQVTVSIVDADGRVLGVARTPDAPVFGADVSIQKARTAAFFSGNNGGNITGTVNYLDDNLVPSAVNVTLSSYVGDSSTFFASTVFTGAKAFSARAIGNISRPFYVDGIDASPNGPLSKPFTNTWSPFNTGLQLDLVYNNFTGAIVAPTAGVTNCSAGTPAPMLNNGIQIFPGAVPIYRGNALVGAIGVSGDGVDQDDMIAFLGLARAGSAVSNAPAGIRADTLSPQGASLRYVNCPQSPFINSSQQNVCSGI